MTFEEVCNNFSGLKWLIRQKDQDSNFEFVIKLPSGKYFGFIQANDNLLENLDIYCFNFKKDNYISYFLKQLNAGISDGRRIRDILDDAEYLNDNIKWLRKRVRGLIDETVAPKTDSLS